MRDFRGRAGFTTHLRMLCVYRKMSETKRLKAKTYEDWRDRITHMSTTYAYDNFILSDGEIVQQNNATGEVTRNVALPSGRKWVAVDTV